MRKQEVLSAIRSEIEQELALITQAAKSAHEAATHSESKAEDQHDTRAIESSYLAGAQAQRAAELQQALAYFRRLEPKKYGPKDAIGPGALIELKSAGKRMLYLIAQSGGGIRVSVGEKEIQVITPQSPIGEELIDRHVGDVIEVAREYEIMAVS